MVKVKAPQEKHGESPKSWTVLSDAPQSYTVEMSVEDWISLPGHPRQRFTERQAKSSHWRLAKRAEGSVKELLRDVAAGELDGTIYKVNGHTRAFLWSQGELPNPGKVTAKVYRCNSLEDLNNLYGAFDSTSAAESESDKIYGAFREVGFFPQSKRLRYGHLATAINLALRGMTKKQQNAKSLLPIDLYKAIGVLKQEFQLLDSVNPQPRVFISGVVAAALIGLSLRPDGLSFFEKLARREGNMREGKLDPVASVLKLIDETQSFRKTWYHEKNLELCGRTLRAFYAWVNEGEDGNQFWFKRRIQEMKLEPLIAEMKRVKGIESDPKL